MSLGAQKGFDATAAKPTTDHPTPPTPAWNVNNQEMLAHIKQERAAAVQPAHQDARAAVVAAAPRVESHPQVAQRQIDAHPAMAQVQHNRPADVHPQPIRQISQAPSTPITDAHVAHPGRPLGSNPSHQFGLNPIHQRPEVTTPSTQIAQNHFGRHTGNPITENNSSTVINNRYDSHNSHNNNRNLYGAMAGAGLLGAGFGYYANRDYGRNYDGSYGNTYGFSDPYAQLSQNYAYNNNDGIYASGYDQYGNPIGSQYVDNGQYLNDGSMFVPNQAFPDANLYGGTTYGGTPFDSGIASAPIFPIDNCPDFGDCPPFGGYERRPNPITAIPALFANLIGGVIGGITNSNHRRYYPPDC